MNQSVGSKSHEKSTGAWASCSCWLVWGRVTKHRSSLRCPCTGILLAGLAFCHGMRSCPTSMCAENLETVNKEVLHREDQSQMVPAPFGGRACWGLSREGQHEMESVLLGGAKGVAVPPWVLQGLSTHWVCSQYELVKIGLPSYYDLQWKYFTNHVHCGVGAFKMFHPCYWKKDRLVLGVLI